MRLRLALAAASISLASTALACSSPADPVGSERSPLAVDSGELVLDRRADGARILGRLEPVREGGDPDRVLVIRTERSGQPIEPTIEGARALDARFAGDRLVVLGADHVLRAYGGGAVIERAEAPSEGDLPDVRRTSFARSAFGRAAERRLPRANVIELDGAAEPPLSVAGTVVAYARGDMPFFEIARADVAAGVAQQVTNGMAPAYSPALSADGREIVFVSSVEGRPRLHRVDAAGTVTALAPTERTPSSPIAPQLLGDRLSFEDEEGATTIDLTTGREVAQ